MSISLALYDQILCPTNQNSLSPSKQISRKLPAITRSCHKRTLVLDLDETLVHSSSTPIENPDDIVYLTSGPTKKTLYVKYRPGLFDFLNLASQKFELVIFTASTKEYAEQVINKFDSQRRILKHRLYREDCTESSGLYIKDLERLGRDLNKVIILDNSVTAFLYHLNNGIPITSWYSDQNDQELGKVWYILEKLAEVEDVRPSLNSFFNLPKLMEEYKNSLIKIDAC